MSLSERIRKALSQRGMTQAEFAHLAGMNAAQISTIVKYDRDVLMSTYAKVDAALRRLEGEESDLPAR